MKIIEFLTALVKLLPTIGAYFAGRQSVKRDYEKSIREILEEDAQEMANRPRTDDEFINRLRNAADKAD